jgi:lipoprotein NlpI
VLWRYLALARSGNQTAGAGLETDAKNLKQADWPYPVVELFLGRRTAEATLAATSKPDEKCEAQFYIGESHLIRGERDRAVEFLKAAVESCPKAFIESRGASAELKRLGP